MVHKSSTDDGLRALSYVPWTQVCDFSFIFFKATKLIKKNKRLWILDPKNAPHLHFRSQKGGEGEPQVHDTYDNARSSILVKAGTQFHGADLGGVRIPGVDLRGVQFDSADLE